MRGFGSEKIQRRQKLCPKSARRLSPPITMQSEGGNFLSLGGGDDGDKRPAPPVRSADGGIDASFHSPAWQEQYLKSLTETRLSYDEFKKREKEREGKLAAAAELAERETLAFRKELERDRKRRLAGGRLGVKSGKVKKEKKSKKKKEKKRKKEKKKEKKSKKSRSRRRDSGSDSSSDSDSSGSSDDEDDPTEKFRLSGFFNKE